MSQDDEYEYEERAPSPLDLRASIFALLTVKRDSRSPGVLLVYDHSRIRPTSPQISTGTALADPAATPVGGLRGVYQSYVVGAKEEDQVMDPQRQTQPAHDRARFERMQTSPQTKTPELKGES